MFFKREKKDNPRKPPTEPKESRENFDQRMNPFFDNVSKWEKWIKDGLSFSLDNLHKAEAHPGQHYDSNIYRTSEGVIWEMTSYPDPGSDNYKGGFQPRGNPEARQRELPEDAVRAEHYGTDDWAWESIEDHNARKGKYGYKRTEDDIPYWSSSVKDNNRNALFAEEVMRRRSEIEAWAREYAPQTDRSELMAYSHDWESLMKFLEIPKSRIPTSNTTEMKLFLAGALDVLVNGKETERPVGY